MVTCSIQYSKRSSRGRNIHCDAFSLTLNFFGNCDTAAMPQVKPQGHHIRKSKDYVYGIWVYKVPGIWKGYYRVKKSLDSCMKPWTEARINEYMKYHSKLTYQLSFWNVSRKVDYHAGGKWFIHGPKCRKENQLPSLKHPCWVSLV